jgi:hypothetical protein
MTRFLVRNGAVPRGLSGLWVGFVCLFTNCVNLTPPWDNLTGAAGTSGAGTTGSPDLDGILGSGGAMQGTVDELRIYDRALSATQVEALYKLTGP